MKILRTATTIFWYILCVYVVMAGLKALAGSEIKFDLIKGLFKLIPYLGLSLLVLVFVMIHLAVRELLSSVPGSFYVPTPEHTGGKTFPSTITVLTGVWLLVVAVLSVLALFWALKPPVFLKALLGNLIQVPEVTKEAIVMMFASAVGSLITTIMGYLDHVSYKKDFNISFVPWYVGRPLMGLLLGLVFYFILKGGLWTVTPTGAKPPEELSLPGLAGIGALVGMFSRNAIEKLREFFQSLFRTEKDMTQKLFDSLPEDLRVKVMPHWERILGESVKSDDKGSLVPTPSPVSPSPVPTPKPTGTP